MITVADVQVLADNIAKSLVDLESAYISNPLVNTPTKTTISNGQLAGSISLTARIAGFNDIDTEAALAVPGLNAANNIVNWMNIANTAFYIQYPGLMVALNTLVGGLNAFLTTNSLEVHSEFANAFNYAANNAPLLGVASAPFTPIAVANIFIPNDITLGTLAVTGATTCNFTVGTAINNNQYAPTQTVLLQNSGTTNTGGTATQFQITYVNGALQTVSTTVQLTGALAPGASLSISILCYSISTIQIVSGGYNGDTFNLIATPLRTVTY